MLIARKIGSTGPTERWWRLVAARRLRRYSYGEMPGARLKVFSKFTFGLANVLLCRKLLLLARR